MNRIRHGMLLAGVLTVACSAVAAAGYRTAPPTGASVELLDGGAGVDAAGPSMAPAAVALQVPPLDATPQPALQPAPQVTLQAPAAGSAAPPSPIHVSGVLQYRLFNSPTPPVAGGANLNTPLTPTPDFPTVNDGIAETAISWTMSPHVSLFADLALESTTGEVSPFATSDIEEAYLDIHNVFGAPGFGSGLRVGRDRIKLGVIGLLLDENVFDGGRRDGFEARATQLAPVSFLGFMQYALDNGLQLFNWTSSRRVWGDSVTAQIAPGWTADLAYRADTADPAEMGTCPGQGCNVGSGWSVGFEGLITPAIDLRVEAAAYTQVGGSAEWYFEPSVTFDLQQLLGLPAQPVLTFWYKNFDPYTPPIDAPLGHLLLPGDFSAFNTNDNLTAVGGELDLTVTPAVGVFFVAEWGTYKDAGPNYSVYSIGVKYNFSVDALIKLSYNNYFVDTGVVTTSPVSGLQLSNAPIYLLELTKSF